MYLLMRKVMGAVIAAVPSFAGSGCNPEWIKKDTSDVPINRNVKKTTR